MDFRRPKGLKKVSKMYRTVPKMVFRSPKGSKNCQKWIEQSQKWFSGARRVVKTVKNG